MSVTVVEVDLSVSIYALCDPATGEVRYVGKAQRPARRWRQHLEASQLNRYKSRKNSWIKGLLAQGMEPVLDILDVVPADQADHAEQEYISLWRYLIGDRLLNGTDGGDGGAVTDPEALARIRAAHVGSKATTETRARMSESAKRRSASPQERARLAAISNGKPPLHNGEAQHCAKLTEAQVVAIRERAAAGETGAALARELGVSPPSMWDLLRGHTWAHVGGPLMQTQPRRRLSESDVSRIRAAAHGGQSQRDLAETFGVSQSHISNIVNAKRRHAK